MSIAARVDTHPIVGARRDRVNPLGLEERIARRYRGGQRRGRDALHGKGFGEIGVRKSAPGVMRSVPGLAVSLWLGAMAFFAFFVAPAAFATLEREAAGRLVSVIFPRYYLAGTVLGGLALVGCITRGLSKGWRGWEWLPLGLVALMLVLTLYAWAVVLPAAHAAREAMRQAGAGASAETLRFARLHRLSGILNGAVMIAGVTLLLVEAMRRP